MTADGGLTFREILMGESLPLGTIQVAVVEFLRGRADVALFGAHAVNLYAGVRRNTEEDDSEFG